EDVTSYPSILGGRVKTLHPKVFGGILHRRDNETDLQQIKQFDIPAIDLVIVDLYPFEKTVASTNEEATIIEKIDIGGISLIRGAAKNFKDVVIVPSANEYDDLITILEEQKGESTLIQRKEFAAKAFMVSSHYDTAIFNYFNGSFDINAFKLSIEESTVLRYGENPHQKGTFYGNLEEVFTQLHGKAISYNNLLDLDAGTNLIKEFDEPTVAILKHNNACGLASRDTLLQAWVDALSGDPISAFGGVILVNQEVDVQTAQEMNKLFFEIILAPSYSEEALEVLKAKKNRIILKMNTSDFPTKQFKSALNGVLEQEKDMRTETAEHMEAVTNIKPSQEEISDLIFANKIVKHTKSNAIVLTKNKQLIGSGVGQTSRVDALKQAITKAKEFGFDLNGAVLASDAFFPFADSVELAHKEGVKSIIQPGGSVRDKDSIDFCNANDMAMVFTGSRHFKH
ncbi:MAG: bifunctional phosphoribosylaminoimidazolecarboxamide formyltransferase/IMP cyclohydrolase, partial [Bacteroidales bacterium]|nr:bifunctional phosphoribosylaminoimidazolecarboxamide formyltransferase/IMP cyclohydrolase [Bacteroidales bacterium]